MNPYALAFTGFIIKLHKTLLLMLSISPTSVISWYFSLGLSQIANIRLQKCTSTVSYTRYMEDIIVYFYVY